MQQTIGTPAGRTIHFLPVTESTNLAAMRLAEAEALDGTVVVAESQTAGRGRRGRVWHSPPGHNIYCSVVHRVASAHAAGLSWVPLAAALATAEAIGEVTGLPSSLKWPNDVLIRGKKVAGILCESMAKGPDRVVVIGIGMNVNSDRTDFPRELQDLATSILMESGATADRTSILTALLRRLDVRLRLLRSEGITETLTSYQARCDTLGKRVHVTLGESEPIEGCAESLGSDGSLCIRPDKDPSCGNLPDLVEIRSAEVIHIR